MFLFLNIWFPLSLLSGAAITFVFFPIWLVRRYPPSRVRKVVACVLPVGIVGLRRVSHEIRGSRNRRQLAIDLGVAGIVLIGGS